MTKIQQIKHQKSMDYWKQLVIAQQQSGLSVTEYCRQQDIKYNAFYYWLRKNREEALESSWQISANKKCKTAEMWNQQGFAEEFKLLEGDPLDYSSWRSVDIGFLLVDGRAMEDVSVLMGGSRCVRHNCIVDKSKSDLSIPPALGAGTNIR